MPEEVIGLSLKSIVYRDVKERGRTIESVLLAYNKFVKKSFDEFITPTMKKADIIVPQGAQNKIAINLIVDSITHNRIKKAENLYTPELVKAISTNTDIDL